MDLHIDKDVALPLETPGGVLYPHIEKAPFRFAELPIVLLPKVSLLATTVEIIHIPMFFSGLIGMRSTWARIGLLTPPTVADPGFDGTLTLELYNASPNAISIVEGDSIWHIVLVSTPFEVKYNGYYQNQSGLTLPKQLP